MDHLNSLTKQRFEELISKDLDYINCGKKCGRSSVCPFAKWKNKKKTRSEEIFCGYGLLLAKSLSKFLFPYFKSTESSDKEEFIDAAADLVYELTGLEIALGLYSNDWIVENYLKNSSFGPASYVFKRTYKLNKIRGRLKRLGVPFFERVAFVEGESVKIFVEELGSIGNAFEFDEIIDFGGITEKNQSKIAAKLKAIEGNEVFYIYDGGDSRSESGLELVSKAVERDGLKLQTFAFEENFEKSFPQGVVVMALQNYINHRNSKLNKKDKINIKKDYLRKAVQESYKENDLVQSINNRLSLRIPKPEFAEYLGYITSVYYLGSEKNRQDIFRKYDPSKKYLSELNKFCCFLTQ